MTSTDRALEAAIVEQLNARKSGATLCPSEAAKAVAGDHTTLSSVMLLEPARQAARRLAGAGVIEFLQGGRPVEPSLARGPVSLRLANRNS
ncbi:MAG: DUF3253 domain-containing protein [Gammaproteobacteria bacterium]